MQENRQYAFNAASRNPGSLIVPLLVLVGVLFVAYYVVKGLLSILAILSPILLIATLVIDREVVWDYGRFVGRLLKDNVLMGLVAVVLTIVGYPVVSGFLFAKAMLRRTFRKAATNAQEQRDGQLVDYEEIVDSEDFLELPPEPVKRSRQGGTSENDYEQLFD